MTEGTSRRFWQICLATLCFFSFLYRWQFAGAWWFHLTLEWTSRNVKEDRAMKGWMNHQHCSSPTSRSYKKKTRKRPTQIPPPTPAAAEEKPLDRGVMSKDNLQTKRLLGSSHSLTLWKLPQTTRKSSELNPYQSPNDEAVTSWRHMQNLNTAWRTRIEFFQVQRRWFFQPSNKTTPKLVFFLFFFFSSNARADSCKHSINN